MPPGTFAPAAATPSTRLKTMKGPGAGFSVGAGLPGYTPGGRGAPMNPAGGSGYYGSDDGKTGSVSYYTPPWQQTTPTPGAAPTPEYGVDVARYSAPRPAAPSPDPGPGIDTNGIPSLLDQFKPDAVPREPGLVAPPREHGAGPEDRTAAESAAFSRAAERIAAVGRGNLAGLRNQMTRRGISGSGIEGKGITDVQNSTAGQLGEVIRDQAIEGLHRTEAIDDRDFAAGIAQRGQDIGVGSTNFGGNITQRGQDVAQSDWKMNALPSILALLRMRSQGTGSL